MNSSYPHPVLGHQDDINSKFEPTNLLGPYISNKLIQFSLSLRLNNATLLDLIELKKAIYAVEVSCKKTYYKKIYKSYEPKFDIAIDAKELKERVNVRLWILAEEKIENYQPKQRHSDYGEIYFSVEVADVLAEHPGFWFIAEKEFDALKAPASSFIVVGKDLEETGPMRVDWNSDSSGKIIITLSSKDFDLYREISFDPNAKKILHGNIVLPVLIQGISAIQNGEDADYNSRLHAIIKAKIQAKEIKNFENEQPILIAQEILKGPVTRSLIGAHSLSAPESDLSEDNDD